MDHVPPKQFFPKSVRTESIRKNLWKVPAHKQCNGEYKLDELQRDIDTTGSVRVPNVAEGTGAELADQFIIGVIRHGPTTGL